jgi:hypothetical protein
MRSVPAHLPGRSSRCRDRTIIEDGQVGEAFHATRFRNPSHFRDCMRIQMMPRPCAVEIHARGEIEAFNIEPGTRLKAICRWGRWASEARPRSSVASSTWVLFKIELTKSFSEVTRIDRSESFQRVNIFNE